MKKNYLIWLLWAFMVGAFSQNTGTIHQNNQPMDKNQYVNEWQKVADFEKRSLPKSASEAVDNILQQAIKDKNSPQVIKALIHQGKYDLVQDRQNDTLIFHNLKEMVAKSTDVVERSVLNSMLAELYLQYYQKDQWNIAQRTPLVGFVPDDMKEWTRNIFYDKAIAHLNASIEASSELLNVKVESYVAVVELGEDSRRFYPSMFDFLMRRALELSGKIVPDEELSRTLARKNIAQTDLFADADRFVRLNFNPQPSEYGIWTLEYYRGYLSSLIERGMNESALLTQLDKLDHLRRLEGAYMTNAKPSLEKMLEQWSNNPMSVEVVDKLVQLRTQELNMVSPEDSLLRKKKTEEIYSLLKKSIAAFPNYKRISVLQNRLSLLVQPSLSVSGASAFSLDGKKELKVDFKNIQSLKAKLYRLSSSVDKIEGEQNHQKRNAAKRTLVSEISIPLPHVEEYWEGESSFTVNPSEYGSYVLTFEVVPEIESNNLRNSEYYFSVTDLAVFSRSKGKDQYHFFVVDRTTGSPIENASIDIYKLPGNWRNSQLVLDRSVTTDSKGLAVYDKKITNNDVFYHAVKGDDKGAELSRLPYNYFGYLVNGNESERSIDIFTDRSLYRPGQTVYFKSVLTKREGQLKMVIPQQKIELLLRDANLRELSKRTLTTNDFGSVAGEFVLPQGLLPGYYSIEARQSGLDGGETVYGNVSFRVEEYKRPTFEVTFDKVVGSYRFGQEVKITGKAVGFSGISLQQATVEYYITRRPMWWRMWGGAPDHFLTGSALTADDGSFEISFTPEKAETQQSGKMIYSFQVEATVTDINGETQHASYGVMVGDVSLLLSLDMPDKWNKKSDEEILISAKNLDGVDVPVKGIYKLFSLQENDSVRQLVADGQFEPGKQPDLKKLFEKSSSGKYRLTLQANDDRGNLVTTEKDFILFSYDDKRPPIKTNEWFIVKNAQFSSTKNGEVLLGASDKINVLYELWQRDDLVEREWITIDNENRLFSVPYKESYKEGVTLMLTYVKDEKFYAQKVDIVPQEKKTELKVSLEVFRDKIRPGAEEEWKVKVTDNDGKPAAAELLASMYDFSLDNIYPSLNWRLTSMYSGSYFSTMRFDRDMSFDGEGMSAYFPSRRKEVTPFVFDRFNWYGYSLYYQNIIIRGASVMNASNQMLQARESGIEIAELSSSKMVLNEAISVNDDMEVSSADMIAEQSEPTGDAETPQIRRNFNETAFFYPQLKTNEKGETLIAFTVPDSNTKWRFRVLAHDKNSNSGTAEAFAVSQKELMVTPNMPRFLRHGDKTSIAAKISNLSDGAVDGVIAMELFDPLTDELITSVPVENRELLFSLDQGASTDAWWSFDVPSDIDVIGVRIVARSEQFSDGEQHALAVLPNRMMVTESLRMDVKGGETKEFVMDRLLNEKSSTAEEYRLTLEFASNPAWYAVQALPVLSEPESDNAVSWFAAYYANLLGAHIGEAFPKVKAMVEAWKRQGGDKEGFVSNLEKNQELKSVLLEETPWVLEAKNETEQKERLSLLFDLNRSRNLTSNAILKLQELQTNQGGWSWFKGFYPSVGITQYILYGFDQLKALNALQPTPDMLDMQNKAVGYIDAEALRRFEDLKRYNKDWQKMKTISLTDLEYLFVRLKYDNLPLDKEVKEMVDFYRSVVAKNWTQYGLYERSLIAIVLADNGQDGEVEAILKSFREHASLSDELGMYWANNQSHVFMSQSAVSVHTFIMDAFRTGGASNHEMDEMKRWLLKQKQTQLWESTHATADAIFALLSDGSDWFTTDAATSISVGGQEVKPEKSELGTGYFKESWSRDAITPQMGKVTVKHEGKAPAWGALYRQYFEEMDKIVKSDGSLDVEKLLFVEKTTSAGKELVRITEQNSLRVGDKVIVRLTIRTDRDLEFVHLKDMRAATFEPVEQLSGMAWQNGIPYYRTSKDASTGFYFNVLPRGTYVFEYAVYVTRPGDYSNGITSIQCMYAPEFISHTAGIRIIVKE